MILGLSSLPGRWRSFSINSFTFTNTSLCLYQDPLVHSFDSSHKRKIPPSLTNAKVSMSLFSSLFSPGTCLFWHFFPPTILFSLLLFLFPLRLIQLTSHWVEFIFFSLIPQISGQCLLFYIPTHQLVSHLVIF